LVLKGADGIVFVADSQEQMLGANVESFRNLEDNLRGHGMNLAEMPHVLQFNKRDLPKLSSIEELNSSLNKYNAPFYESVATTGIGVQDTLKAIVKLVLLHLTRKYDPAATTTAATQPRPAPMAVAPATPKPPTAPAVGIPVSGIGPEPRASAPMEASGPSSPPMEIPAASTPPPPPDFRGAPEDLDLGPAATEFGDDEIDDLVGEVGDLAGDVPSDPEPLAEQPMAAASRESGGLQHATTDGFGGAIAPQNAGPADAFDTEHDTAFEVDRGFDPEFGDSVRTTAGRPRPPQPPSLEDPLVAGSGTIADDTVLLTEVAADSDLFNDPDLEVARLQPGETREIEVPVEVGEGANVRRFKLTIRLHIDGLD
ncbi:MAG: GTPase domain-containing protein, partial [Acidobacteriota bacterium]|nr:GTPase domain-containing protein [Acidobacteriota bacterium]